MSPPSRRPSSLRLIGLLVLAFGSATSAAQSRSARTVLAVYWSSEDYPGTAVVDAGIRQVLMSDPDIPVDFFAEYLESDLFPPQDASVALRDYIKRKFNGRHIDVVLSVSDPALEFVLRYRADLFPDAPIVASGTSPVAPEIRAAGAGLTGIIGGVSYSETLELALKLHPASRRVFVIAHAPTVRLSDAVRTQLQAFADRVELTYLDEPSVDRMLDTIKNLPPDSLVLFIRHSQQEPGDVLYPADVVRRVTQVSPVPVYGQNESYLGAGIVGGVIKSPSQMGHRIGEMSHQLLAGTRAQDMPMEPVPLATVLDWRQVVRWHVPSSLVPSGADIRFRQLTPWEQYRAYIVCATTLMLVQTTLIVALLVQQRRRRRAELALERANAELNRVSRLTALGEFAASIAHEVRQPLHAMILMARSCLHRVSAPMPDLDEVRADLTDIVDAGQRAGEVIQRNRELFKNRSVQTTPLDINSVIEEAIVLVRTRLTEQHIAVSAALADGLPAVSGDRIELQQVLLNLIANSIDAMERVEPRSKRIEIVSARTDDGVKVTITDTGVGLGDVDLERMFSLSYTTKAHGTGVGLSICRSIIEAHGGRLWAEQAAGSGATFCFTLPGSH